MNIPITWRACALAGTALAFGVARPAFAQISDVSDGFWSIVVPAAAAVDVDMGMEQVGGVRDSLVSAFITNTGSVAVRIDSIFFTGAGAGAFRLASGIPPFNIPQGESRGVEFRFSPPAAGRFTATVVIHTQADTLRRSIQGEGVLPQIAVEAQLVDFGQMKVNAVKDTSIAVVVRNIGSGTLSVSGVEQLGPDVDQFAVMSGGGSFALTAGQGRAMTLRFAPLRAGRTSGRLGFHHSGAGSPAVVDLFGEGVGVQGMATLHVDTIRARPGELVDVPIYLRNAQDLDLTGATAFHSKLRYDASLLSPVGSTPAGSVTGGERMIPLDNLPVQPDARGVLATLHFVATLGAAEGTPLRLEDSYASGGKVTVSESPGYFLLTDLCRDGGVRLFNATGVAHLAQNRPNPFNSETVIEFETIEDAPARLVVQDLTGRTVAVLLDGVRPPGRYAVSFNASSLPSGSYFCILESGTQRFVRVMEVVK